MGTPIEYERIHPSNQLLALQNQADPTNVEEHRNRPPPGVSHMAQRVGSSRSYPPDYDLARTALPPSDLGSEAARYVPSSTTTHWGRANEAW